MAIILLLIALFVPSVAFAQTPSGSLATHVICDSGCAGVGGSGVTDAEIRATPVPVSGTVTFANASIVLGAGSAVIGHVILDSGAVTFSNTTLAVTNTGTFAVQATLAAETTKVIGTVNIAAAQSVAITGNVAVTGTFWQVTQPVSFTQPALVAGSALIGKVGLDQTTPGTTNKVSLGSDVVHAIVDSGAVTVSDGAGALNVIVDSATLGTVTVSDGAGALNTIVDSGSITANAGTNLNTSLLALEAGGNLASIKAKTDNIPALGQALAGASAPVVLPAAQITTLTPPAAITGYALESAGNLAGVRTAVETIDNFISGSRGLVTEDNSALIKAALDTLNAAVATAANQTTELGYLQTVAGAVHLEDQPVADGDKGIYFLAQRNDNATILTSADLDYSPVATDSHGHLNVRPMGKFNPTGAEQVIQTTAQGVQLVQQWNSGPPLPLFPCNAVRRTNCAPKGF